MEIGGYIELDHYHLPMLHDEAIKLNCGRNALAYLIRAKHISKIVLPYFLCDSVFNLCNKEAVEMRFYHVDSQFYPEKLTLAADEWLYVVNFYGQLKQSEMEALVAEHHRVIVDQAQAYFTPPVRGADTLYTCRKFFGVADGAFLYTDRVLDEELETDESFERMRFLLGRFERSASEFYGEYVENNHLFAKLPIRKMSALTENLLHAIDYEAVKKKRTDNFEYIARRLGAVNQLQLITPIGPFAYPLLLENGEEIKKELIAKKIFVPTLWPNVLQDDRISPQEERLVRDLVILPCDQRYGAEDMQYMVDEVKKCIG